MFSSVSVNGGGGEVHPGPVQPSPDQGGTSQDKTGGALSIPGQDRGYLPLLPLDQDKWYPLPPDRTGSIHYAAGSTPLAVTQEDFLDHHCER